VAMCSLGTHTVLLYFLFLAGIFQSVWRWATGWAARLRLPEGARDFLSSTASRPALGLTQPPIQRVPGALSTKVRDRGVTVITLL
jgi:hypothetical protein